MFQTEFIARLHPLIVHLPIGILLFAFAMMILQRFRQIDLEAAIALGLLFGAISATLACAAGWLLAQSGTYEDELVFKHQWTGIATALLGFGAYYFKPYRWVLATATVLMLTIAGHYGGTLTHGEDFLITSENNIATVLQKNDTAQYTVNQPINRTLDSSKGQLIERKTFIYQDKIAPILKDKCYNCHSATKKKGGLRLDTEGFIRKGGKNGPILAPGNPLNSTLLANLLLPIEDEKHMPPKGKAQLTAQEIAAIHYWIKQGASFVEQIETFRQKSQTITQGDAIPILKGFSLPINKIEVTNLVENELPEERNEAANPILLERLKQQQIEISQIKKGSNNLSANFVNVKNYSSAMIDDLEGVNNQVVMLKLSGQPVNDEDVRKVAGFKKLTRLNLENTNITDAALVHLKNLQNLEVLNLYGTNVTDKGIESLTNCTNLKVVYLWKTKVTPEKIKQLKKALPQLKVEMGSFNFVQPDTNKVKYAP